MTRVEFVRGAGRGRPFLSKRGRCNTLMRADAHEMHDVASPSHFREIGRRPGSPDPSDQTSAAVLASLAVCCGANGT